MSVTIRDAAVADVPFLVALVRHPEVAPYLAVIRPSSPAEVADEIARATADPAAGGVIVIEDDGRPVGSLSWERVNARSRIASIGGVAVLPEARGRGVATRALRLVIDLLLRERGLHRLQLEVYAFNRHAIERFARAGFTQEGVRRRAYLRDGEWVDGILFGLVAEDLSGHTETGEGLGT